ncbi:unnamed protein product, partial [Rotaria sp. Silwood1]
MKVFQENSSLTVFLVPQHESDTISAAEGVFIYHGVKHGHSYNSQKCTISLVRNLFESSSSVAKLMSCGKTKARSITCNVLGPYFTRKLIDDLSKAQFYSISVDASNKGNRKMFPFAVQYFAETGVARGLVEFIEDPHESANDIVKNICKIIKDHNLKIENLTSLGADNANVNFGEYHSVFKLLKDLQPRLRKGNCYGHVLHNSVKTAHDDLPIDIETILCKAYSYFSRSAKRLESLKEYFEFVQVDFDVLLKHISTRWLSLLPSIERLLEKFEPVKQFFLNQPTSTKAQQVLNAFFQNDEGLCILNFLQNVLTEIQKAELQLQRSNTTVVDLHFIITNLINKLRQKLVDKFYGNKTRLILNQLKQIDQAKNEELTKAFELFIDTVIVYIKSYFDSDNEFYEKLSFFNAKSFEFLTWEKCLDVVDILHIDDLDIDKLHNEFCDIKYLYDNLNKRNIKLSDQINSYISSKTNSISSSTKISLECIAFDDVDDENIAQVPEDHNIDNSIRSDQLWSFLLNYNPNSAPNLYKLICYVFSIPCSNSYVESIFSHMKHVWSDYRNRMDIKLVSAE